MWDADSLCLHIYMYYITYVRYTYITLHPTLHILYDVNVTCVRLHPTGLHAARETVCIDCGLMYVCIHIYIYI